MSDPKPITVARPSLPPLAEFFPYLERIWASGVLTNGGPMHEELECALAAHLKVPFVSLFNNGTNALLTALQALDLEGEVITTPYSFVATANSLVWNRLTPVFVDIDAMTCNLDPARIEAAITPRTLAIMPVHCYGIPCDVEAIADVARRHGLKVVYDAAHAFGVKYRGCSLLAHGDLAVLSFHATKVFNTFEGGAIVSRDADMKSRIDRLKNFGFVDEVTITECGTNGKMNEVQAAFGLLQLHHLESAIARRRAVASRYRDAIATIEGLSCLPEPTETEQNYSYFPILVGPELPMSRDELYASLKKAGILARRYFFPLLNGLPGLVQVSRTADSLATARRTAAEVLCLPLHASLSAADVDRVLHAITEATHGGA